MPWEEEEEGMKNEMNGMTSGKVTKLTEAKGNDMEKGRRRGEEDEEVSWR